MVIQEEKRLSSGVASVMQIGLLLFFAPFLVLLTYIVIKNPSTDGIVFLISCGGVSFLILRRAMASGDVTLRGDQILIEKLFRSETKSLKDYKSVDSTLLPIVFCLKFKSGSKVYFTLKNSDMYKHLWNSNPKEILNKLKAEFENS